MRAAWAMIAATVLTAACDAGLNHLIGLAGSGSGATHLVFTVQPSNTTASLAITPAVVVVAQNASGNADTAYTNSVTVALGANPGGGTLSGTLSISAARGVATFSNLHVNAAGTGYTLTGAAPLLTSATSAAFNITP
jgi:hypothetical protein